MTKAQVVEAIRKQKAFTTTPKRVIASVLDAAFEEIARGLSRGKKGERFTYPGFGTFSRKDRKKRLGRNPRNPELPLEIPAHRTVVFRPAKELKSKLNGRRPT
jgi:DNA-binding protein HU-beta